MALRFLKSLLVISITGLLVGGADAQSLGATDPAPRLITNPIWLKRPTGNDLAAHYPEKAMDKELGGRATIECRVDAKGRLQSCRVLNERPEGYDFGKAVLKLSRLFVMSTSDRQGEPTEGALVMVPIVYTFPR